jgi:hypothetical protein
MKKSHLLLGLFLLMFVTGIAQQYSIRFYGHGFDDSDRIKIPLTSGVTSLPNNVAFDFTIEFWIKATTGSNVVGNGATTGNNDDWTLGHIIVDRDIFGAGNFGDYGISLSAGRIAFGVNNGPSSYTLIGTGDLRDGMWHHVAVTRSNSTGLLMIFVNGTINASGTGPTGNISYNPNRSLTNGCGAGSNPCTNEPFIVLGAEKHDYDPTTYPSFDGWIDELRISNSIRYTSNFSVPSSEFSTDLQTVALFHFNEGSGFVVTDNAGSANGILVPHPNSENLAWSADSPFQSLSIVEFDWHYSISDKQIIIYGIPEFGEDDELMIEHLNPQYQDWVELNLLSNMQSRGTKKVSFAYDKGLFHEGFYRVSKLLEQGSKITGTIRYIKLYKEKGEFTFFPNPVIDVLTISSERAIKSITLYDVEGKVLNHLHYLIPINSTQFDCSRFPIGVYFLQVNLQLGHGLHYRVIKSQ